MDAQLQQRLPLELVEIIMRRVHRLNFQPVLDSIKYNITWFRADGEYSFLVHNTGNYYEKLIQWEDGEPIAVHTSDKGQSGEANA
jgi:hypothetical protein